MTQAAHTRNRGSAEARAGGRVYKCFCRCVVLWFVVVEWGTLCLDA